MQVPENQHRRRRLSNCGSKNSCVRRRAQHKDLVWSYDFVTDRTEDRRQIRLLVVEHLLPVVGSVSPGSYKKDYQSRGKLPGLIV